MINRYVTIPKNQSCAYVVVFFLYLSGDVIFRRTLVSTSVMSVAIKVINDSTKGNIPFVDPESCDCSNWPGILIKLDVANIIMSMIILPIKPAIIHHRALMPISVMLTFFGPNDIVRLV